MSVEQQTRTEQNEQMLSPEQKILQEQQQAQQDIVDAVPRLTPQMSPDKAQMVQQVTPKIVAELAKENTDMVNVRDKARVLDTPHDQFGELNLLEQFLVQAPLNYLQAMNEDFSP